MNTNMQCTCIYMYILQQQRQGVSKCVWCILNEKMDTLYNITCIYTNNYCSNFNTYSMTNPMQSLPTQAQLCYTCTCTRMWPSYAGTYGCFHLHPLSLGQLRSPAGCWGWWGNLPPLPCGALYAGGCQYQWPLHLPTAVGGNTSISSGCNVIHVQYINFVPMNGFVCVWKSCWCKG